MTRLRRVFTVLSLLAGALVLPAAPAAAQDGDKPPPPLTVFVLVNAMTNAERAGADDEEWQVRISVRPLGNCTPTRGPGLHETHWLDAGDEAGTSLSLNECVFRLAAEVRDSSLGRPCRFTPQMAWGADPGDSDYLDGPLLTSDRPDGASRLSIRRKPGSGCAAENRTHFVVRGGDIVEAVAGDPSGDGLLALARRAAELTTFAVRVEPDPTPGTVGPVGCDRATNVPVRADGRRSSAILRDDVAGSGPCPLRATILTAPAPFEAPEGSSVGFDGGGANILVDLSRLVRLRPMRITIIQDTTGSLNRGAVSYAIERACGDVTVRSTPPAGASSQLYEGRYTVHAPHVAVFGPTATYPVGAASATSTNVVGCSVTVTVSDVPAGCSVAVGTSRTITWTAADAPAGFDFEFAINCGDGRPGSGADPGNADAATDADVRVDADADVRVVARKLADGRIEFGLQQLSGITWSDRKLPRARFFPTGARIGRWLASSVLTVNPGATTGTASAERFELRIVARRLADGRVEFGVQERHGGSWGDRRLPRARFFPAGADVGRWLHASPLTLGT